MKRQPPLSSSGVPRRSLWAHMEAAEAVAYALDCIDGLDATTFIALGQLHATLALVYAQTAPRDA